ncbi:MAG: PaaI family thioesterase [Hyphomicrobiaceae bacterium]|nr:MAG: PaaI family thioesterase [Hyphomicrobiaceae bacterium]
MTDTDFAPLAAAIRKALDAQGFHKLVGAEVVDVAPGEATLALDRRPEVLQQAGLFHGGVIAYLVDNATTVAAATVVDRARQSVLTAEYKLNIVAPARGDRLVCRATVLKRGRMLTVVEAKVHCRSGAEEKLTAVALASIANIDLPSAA